MSGTIILPCQCKDAFQDETYGKGMRVHNKSGKDKHTAYCTNCSPSNFRDLRHRPVKKAGDRLGKSY